MNTFDNFPNIKSGGNEKNKETIDSSTLDKSHDIMEEHKKDSPSQAPSLGIPNDTIEEFSSDFPSTQHYSTSTNELFKVDSSSDSKSSLMFSEPNHSAEKKRYSSTVQFNKTKGKEIVFHCDRRKTRCKKSKKRRNVPNWNYLHSSGPLYQRRLEIKYMRLLEKHVILLEDKIERLEKNKQ